MLCNYNNTDDSWPHNHKYFYLYFWPHYYWLSDDPSEFKVEITAIFRDRVKRQTADIRVAEIEALSALHRGKTTVTPGVLDPFY